MHVRVVGSKRDVTSTCPPNRAQAMPNNQHSCVRLTAGRLTDGSPLMARGLECSCGIQMTEA